MRLIIMGLFILCLSCQTTDLDKSPKEKIYCKENKNNLAEALVIFKNKTKKEDQDYALMGNCYYYNKQYGVGLLFFQKSLSANPLNHLSLLGMAKSYQKLGDSKKALIFYEKLLKNETRSLDFWRFYTDFTLNYLDIEEGEKALRTFKKVGGDKSLIYLYLSYIKILKGEIELGRKIWNQLSVQNLKNYPEAAFSAAYIAKLLDDKIKEEHYIKIAKKYMSPYEIEKWKN